MVAKKQSESEKINERHKVQVQKYYQTSNDIEISNLRAPRGEPKKHIKITPYWNQKAQVQDNFMQQYKNTQDRLFGAFVNNYSLQRADYIRKCQTRERNYDIVGNFSNNIELKKDKGLVN